MLRSWEYRKWSPTKEANCWRTLGNFSRTERRICILILVLFFIYSLQSYWRLFCADLDSKSVATWLPSIYYNRQQHLLKAVMEKTGTTGMVGVEDESPHLSDSQRKRKRSLWTKQKGFRRESYDVHSTKSDSQLTANYDRKASTCSVLDSDFIGETLPILWL